MPKREIDALPQGAELTARDAGFRDCPDPIYDALRTHAPHYDDLAYGRTLLTRHDDVRAALRHKRFSVDARLSGPDSYVRRIAGTGVDERQGEAAYTPPLVLLDDPDHRRIRLLMSKAFNPQSIAAMRERIEIITRELLDACRGRDSIDLIADVAAPLPTQAILEMMGMPVHRRDDFKRWSEAILMGYDPERDRATQARLRDAYIAMGREFQRVVDARRASPREDLISAMVRAQEHRDRLTDLEIISLCTQLMVAGNVTTTDLIGNGIFALLENAHELARLRADPALIDNAVEEMLRFDCPITETARIPLHDDRLNGCPVHAGTTFTASLAAANHDPAVFPEPHRFDITRDASAHLAFGSGIHVCLGAPLARLEARIAIGEILARWPRLRRDPEITPRRRALPFFRGFTRLPVRIA